nr:hypothetical protein pLIS51_00021c [Listeria seeligeri]
MSLYHLTPSPTKKRISYTLIKKYNLYVKAEATELQLNFFGNSSVMRIFPE